jgi:hypothetical protein
MSRLAFSESSAFDPGRDFARFVQAARKAVETYDFDSGWIVTPITKQIQHKLGVLPKAVLVYASSVASGNPFSGDTFTACDTDKVTITGPLAYCRVLVNA